MKGKEKDRQRERNRELCNTPIKLSYSVVCIMVFACDWTFIHCSKEKNDFTDRHKANSKQPNSETCKTVIQIINSIIKKKNYTTGFVCF